MVALPQFVWEALRIPKKARGAPACSLWC